MVLLVSICLSVSLSVCEQDYSRRGAWIWMKCCVSADVATWTNWLTFEPDPDYSPDAKTRLLSPISYALQCGILLRRENPTYRYWVAVGLSAGMRRERVPPRIRKKERRYWVAAKHSFKMVLRRTAKATRGCTMVLFTASCWNNLVGGTCDLPSVLLVLYM